MTEKKVLLVRIILGRGTIRHHPLNQDQPTKLLNIEQTGNNHGLMIEMIPAVKIFDCYYRIIRIPDGTEIKGDIFFNAKYYTELSDTPLMRKGICEYIRLKNKEVKNQMERLQKSRESVERYFESFAQLK